MCRLKNGNKSGVLVVEASIVVTLVVAVITVMLYIGMVMYRQTLSSVMANQTASNIAAVYGNNLKDPVTGYIEPDKVYQTVTYGNMKTDAYTDVVRQKGEQLAVHSLKSSNILASESTEVDVDIVKKSGELLKSQIVVTIKDKYKVPLVGLFGVDGTVEFSATGYADCVDVLEYINGVDAVSDTKNSNLTLLPDLDVCNVIFIPDESDLTSVYTVAVARGESILSSNKYTGSVMPSEPSNAKYNFAGWVDAYGTDFTATRTVNSDITVYGEWMCSVTLNANGGTVRGGSLSYGFSVPRNSRTYLDEPTKANHTFEGWFDKNGIQYFSNDTVIKENVTLTAEWKKRTCTVTFDANKGSLPVGIPEKESSVIYGETRSMPEAYKPGYILVGWKDGNTKYTVGEGVEITKDVKFTAEWKTCTNHVAGDCGIDHEGNAYDPEHAGSKTTYFGTTKFKCLVCYNCGALLDGNNNESTFGLGDYHGASGVSYYYWCTEHKNQYNNNVTDDYWENHPTDKSAGTFDIHGYKQ